VGEGEDDLSPSLFDLGYEGAVGEEEGGSDGNPPSPPTTCFSPVFSAKNSSSAGGPPGLKGSGSRGNETAFDVSNLFSPYSTALSVTIAIGEWVGGVEKYIYVCMYVCTYTW
jgi:hypothetical protein